MPAYDLDLWCYVDRDSWRGNESYLEIQDVKTDCWVPRHHRVALCLAVLLSPALDCTPC